MQVVVRIRPVNRREREGVRIVRKLSSDSLSADDRKYTFDSVLGPDSSQVRTPHSSILVLHLTEFSSKANLNLLAAAQDDVFKLVGVRLVRDSLAGFNTSILCYGQVTC